MPRRPPRTVDERMARTQRSMTPGTLSGRVAAAKPVPLNPPSRTRAQPPPTAGGFDPTADPVVIGMDADAGGVTYAVVIGRLASVSVIEAVAVGFLATATGDNATALGSNSTATNNNDVAVGGGTTASHGNSTALGFGASATGASSVAVGDTPHASGSTAVAIGYSAQAISTSAIAIGKSAAAVAYGVAIGELAATQANDAIAVGHSANVHLSATRGTAVGYGAGVQSFHAHSTALGAEANTTAANQIMLGTAADFVEIPGDSSTAPNGLVLTDTDGSGTRWLAQVTGGSLVLSAAP